MVWCAERRPWHVEVLRVGLELKSFCPPSGAHVPVSRRFLRSEVDIALRRRKRRVVIWLSVVVILRRGRAGLKSGGRSRAGR